MNKIIRYIFVFFICFMVGVCCFDNKTISSTAFAKIMRKSKKYYTVYESDSKDKILFLKGDEVSVGDKYLSHNNKLYEIVNVDDEAKTAVAKYLNDEILPKVKLKNNKTETTSSVADASANKKVGVYHTHNDESYYTPDGIDSVYGKGGIHDVGKEFVSNLKKLKIDTLYREDLHLPHNSGAYTRSQVTASALLDDGAQAIFDLHRDSTKRSEYLTKVDGKQMSAVRMVVGSSSKNYEENKKFAYKIKSYADEVYPGLIKDIYFGKGNYNQGLTTKAMLFEMGCENIEKSLVLKTTPYLAKVVDVILYGTEEASDLSVADLNSSNVDIVAGVVNSTSTNSGVNSNETLIVILSVLGVVLVTFGLVMIFSKNARYKVSRFFSELFAGIFGKRKKI